MTYEQKIEYARNYLQRRLEEEFVYPFKVIYEDRHFVFTMKNGKAECRARTRNANEIIHTVVNGSEEEKKELVNRVFGLLQAAVRARESTVLSQTSDYEKIRGELILRPLCYRNVREDLRTVPHIRMGEIALALYAVMAHVGNDYFTAKVHRNQIASWKRSESAILEEALINTSFLYPPRLYTMDDLVNWDTKSSEDGVFMGDHPKVRLHGDVRGMVLTNTLELNGAIAMFYPGVAERIAGGFDNDFYIGFTSVHEAQIHPVGAVPPEVIRESLMDTNRVCNKKEDVLSGRVYLYDRARRSFSMLVEGERREVYWNVR